MKAFSLFFIPLSSIVRSDGDLEKGGCGTWKRIDGATVDRGGYDVPYADSPEACQLQCYLFKAYCELITWTKGRSPGCQHVLPNSRVNWVNDTASTAFWLQGDTDCEVDCPDAFKAWTNWKVKDEYAVTTGDRTLKGCRARCLRNTDCIAFDLCPGDQCHFQTEGKENDRNKSKDCLYVALKRPGCKEKAVPSRSKSLRTGNRCAQFTGQKYTRGVNIGSVQPHILNEDLCQEVCATFKECVAVDWLSAEENGVRGCVFYDFDKPPVASHAISTHYTMINRGNCPVECINAFRAIFDKRSTLKLTPSEYITTLYGCMEECVGQKRCYAIEWRDPSAAPRCWLQLEKKTDFYKEFQKDYVIYQIGRPWCKETIKRTVKTKSTRTTTTTTTTQEPTTMETREVGETLKMITDPPTTSPTETTTTEPFTKATRTIFESIESCADWSKGFDTRSATNGSYQPHIANEEMCKKACLAFHDCESVDWLPGSERKCHLTDVGGDGATLSETGSYHWTPRRLGLCVVDCSYSLRAKENSKFGLEGEQKKYANTFSNCKKACLSRDKCRGFDWLEQDDVGQRCFLQFEAYDKNRIKENRRSTFYEVGRPLCKEPIKTASPVVAECIDAFVPNERKRLDQDGERYGDANTVPECKTACLELDECYGFNWKDGQPQGRKCFLQFVPNGNTVGDSGSTYYQLGRPGSGCRGSCIDWTRIPDAAAKSGVTQTAANEDDCKFECLKTLPKCESLDWIPGDMPKCIHHFTGESQELQNEKGAVHWKIKGIQCTGTCTEWTRVPDVETNFGVQQTGISTEKMCKIKCIATFPGCQSIDWIPTGNGVCYHHFNGFPSIEKTNKGAVHWEIKGLLCEDSCGSWTKFEDTSATAGVFEPDISSEEMCRIACMVEILCRSLDWIRNAEKQCSLHYDADSTANTVGAVHWVFKRIRNCEINGQDMILTTVKGAPEITTSTNTTNKGNKTTVILIIIGSTAATMLFIGLVVMYIRRTKMKDKKPKVNEEEKKLLAPAKLSAKAKMDEKLKPKLAKIKRKLASIRRPGVTGKKTKAVPKKGAKRQK